MSAPAAQASEAPDSTSTYVPHIDGVFSMRMLPLVFMLPVVVFGAGLFGYCVAGEHWTKARPVEKDE